MSFIGNFVRPRHARYYEPIATWQDRRGYTLSDRIWHLSETTEERIDAVLANGMAQGRSAVAMARDLEGFLRPSRRGVTTRTPYGSSGSYDARRLARSEITRASSLAGRQARLANRFVVRTFYHLSASHKADPGDICEAYAEQSEQQGGWEPGEEPLPAVDTHPQCICYNTDEVGDLFASIEAYRVDIVNEQAPITPLAAGPFIAWVLGRLRTHNVTRQVAGIE